MAKSFEDFRAGYVGAGKTAEQNTLSNSFADFRKNYVKKESLDLAIMKPFAGPVSIMDQKPEVIDYEGDYTKKVSGQKPTEQSAQFDSASVIKLGAGPLSDNAVAEKVNIGELKISGQSKDGKFTVEKNPDYVPTYTPKPSQVRAATDEELKNRNLEREYGKEDEMGDDFISWLGKAQDSTLPTAALTGRRADAAGKTVGAAAENVAGSLLNKIGFLGDLAFQGMQMQVAVETGINAEKRGEDGDEVYSQIMDRNTAANAQKEQMFAPVVDTLMSNAEELHQEAYIAAGKEGKFLVDLLYTGTQMAGDLAANLLVPGSGLALMASRVFGQAAYEARMNGADQATQLVYGLKAAVIEYLTEKLGGGAFKKLYGPGVVDNAIESMLGRLLKTDKGRTVIRFLLECTGEGLEEVISDIANPIADRLLGLDDGEGAIITDEDLSQMWYDFALGTALGGMGSAVNLTAGSYEQRNVSLRTAEAAQRALVDSGLESDANTQSYKLAEEYKKTLDSGRMLSNSQVKKLTEANDAAIRNEVAQQSAIDAVRNATPEHIAQLFEQRGEQASPQLVEGVSNLLNDRSVTSDQVQAIEQSDNAAQVVQELAGETVRSNEAPAVEEPMEAWDQDNIVESMFPNEVKSGILDGRDIAQIQGFYDNTGRSIDLNELEAMVSDYIKNKKEAKRNEGRKENSDGGVGRQSGMGAGEQAGGIQKSAGRDQSEKRGNDARGEETRRSSGKKPQREKISGKSLNIPHGTDSQKLTVVKPDGVNARIVNAFSTAAKSITLVNGAIEQQKNDAVITVSGLTTADGRVFARMDHRLYNGTKVLLHECGHLYMDDSAMRSAMHNAAADVLTGSKLEELANSYALLWKGLYKMPEGITTDEELADYFENNPDAYTEFLEAYEQEIWCDALAGLDRIKAAGASKLTDTVRSIFKDYTGIDVDAILNGTETGDTTFRTERGKAERIAPRNNSPPSERYSADEEFKKPITEEDIKILRSIGRKSINEFSSEDIEKSKKWAYKFYQDLGIKSPFFRAWFGDWRVNDSNETKLITENESNRGSVVNTDTGWSINVSRKIYKETTHHSSVSVKGAVKYLPYISDITKNAVLFNTEVSNNENNASLLFHSMYAYTECMGYPAILKLRVEELFNEKSDTSIKRDYILQEIKEEPISGRRQVSTLHHTTDGSYAIKISELFDLVKKYDSSFKPKPASVIVNDDGTPKVVYHGTDAEFTVFDKTKSRANMDIQGSFFSPWEIDAAGYGANIGAYYLNIKNPATESMGYRALNKYKGQNNAGIKAREWLISKGYDGVNNSDEEYIAFESNQIKSATDNTGTFNGENDDVNYSVDDAAYMEAVESGDMETAQRMVDEAARAAGYSVPLWHGTPNGTFNVFRDWQYFTPSKEYADIYQGQGASVNFKKTADNPRTYAVYAKLDNVFDTRNDTERDIFENEFYLKWGNGAPLSERGLPDWTDGDDFIEFFEEYGYDYDTLLLDEGGTGGYGEAVNDRGISYVIKNSAQVKSADPVTYDDDGNVIPLSERFDEDNEDIRYSADDAEQAELNVKSAEKYFGTTYRIAEAGYLLTDGKLLDFSGKHDGAPGGYRTVDHRDIVDALGDDYGGDDYSGGMIRFMSEGNIRLSPESGGINLSVKPNKFQLATLDRFISSFRGEVLLDIDDAAGNTVVSIEYPRRTYSKKIIDAINAYFDDGIIPEQPEQSTTAMFHDSYSADEESYIEAGDSARMTKSRIDYLIEDSGAGRKKDYAQMWITSINPTDFINLTTDKVQDRKLFDKYPGDYGTTVDEYDFIEGLKNNMRQTPYLNIDEYGNVIGHEGRHRMRALERKGVASAEIVVKFYDSDGRMIKNVHAVNGRLETIERATFSNQMGTGQTASVENLIPLNLDHKDEVLESYGEDHAAENDIRYSADDALLVDGDPDYTDTLSKVREDARRYSAAKLEERISNFDGRIKGYEDTANRTERMELELQDLRNRRKVYAEALKRKKAKNDERRQANESAKTEAKAMAQRITDAQGRNKSKATLRETVFRDFNIQEGRSEAAEIINAFADKYADQGRISRKDLNGLFDALMSRGLFIAEAEDYARELRSHLAGNSVRVPSEVKAEFGDDWINFYRRAWGNNIYLKVDSGSNGIDTWTMELADAFGEGTFDVTADMKTQLERIVDLAEQGKAEKMDLFQMAEYIRKREGRDTADAIIDELYRKLENAVKNYATNAKLEMELTYKNAFQQARDRAVRQENARRAQEKKQLREQQQNTLKQLQALKKMRDRTSNEFREQIDRVLEGIDTIAISAANAMNYSKKYEATWESITDMYEEAKVNDPNFLPDDYIEKHLIPRLKGKHLDEMEPADLEQLYQAAVALRTKIYNTQNIIGSETNMLFNEAFEAVSNEMRTADKPNVYGLKWAAMRNAMNPIHYMEALASWNPDSVWYKTFARGLEDGERKMKRYVETSKQMLDEFARTHRKWLEVADGQGKNGIWYEIKVSPVAEWRKGDQPIFGEPITVYMTPLQKVHMYLESKNYDNLAHMLGGRVFADKELYSKGNKDEAFASDPIHLAPADVRRISSDLTPEELELANILERYYNTYAKTEINKVSNELYGFDRAMADNYAPIFTKDTYNTFTPAVIDGTAEGVGHMKTRIKGARTPTVNISAMDAFNKHVSQTSRFVGMSIPLHNMKGILNWTQNGKPMREVIEQEWSNADLEYIEKLVTELQNPHFADEGYIEKTMDKLQSAYIGSVFGFNPSVALKVFGSWALASAELGFENAKGALTKVDPALIRKYTSEYDVRVRGYSSPEMARLVNSQGAIEKAIQSNKITKELFGGGLMIHTDAIVARSLWAWSEAAVRSENPDLEVGTQEQIDAGESPFYKEVAKRFNKAVGDTQSMYDIMHRSALLRDDGAVSRAFTMFHTDIMQAANLLVKAKGEKAYYRKALKADPENAVLKAKAQWYEKGVKRAAYGVVTSSMLVALVSVLNSLYKRRDEFYDENNEFMWDKFGTDYAIYILKDFFGMLPGVDVVAGGLIDHFRGEKWYDVEVMGLSLFNDLVDKGIKVAAKIIDGTATLEDYKDLAFLVARRFSLPFDNIERYMLGLFSWVAPEIGEAYNNMISPPDKSDLKGKSGEVLEQDVYDMYKGFGLEREATDELARLYDLGYDKIIYGKTPEHITVDGVEYILDKEASERYESTLRETLSKLGEVIASEKYQDADDKDRMKMLKRVNSYATETAKAAAVPEYDMAQWVESCKDLIDGGDGIMTVAMMPYTEKTSSSSGSGNDPRYVKLVDAGVEYNNARDIEEKLTMLLPEAGKTNVTEFQKINAIALMPIPESDKAAALGVIADNNSFIRKLYNATSSRFSLLEICDMYSAVIRKSEKGSFTQENFIEVVAEQGIPYDVASAIWNAKWQPKNNPYD